MKALINYQSTGELSQKDQENFNTSIHKITRVINSFDEVLNSDLASYKAFTNPDEKMQ